MKEYRKEYKDYKIYNEHIDNTDNKQNKKFIIAGNWKMNCNLNESVSLLNEIKNLLCDSGIVPGLDNQPEMLLFPPFTNLAVVSRLTEKTGIKTGAQTFFHHEKGAYTGEISADMIKSAGAEYVLVGHSERREIFKETDEILNKKLLSAQKQGLKPVFCVGETLRDRENQKTFSVLRRQLREGLSKCSPDGLVIAYEPVWAIGTGKTASPDQAQAVHQFIFGELNRIFMDKAGLISILYGGSVSPENAGALFERPWINGALIGGASLSGTKFVSVYKSGLSVFKNL